MLSFYLIKLFIQIDSFEKTLQSSTKSYGCFAGTHIDYNLSRQLLQYFVPIVEQGISHNFNKKEVFELDMQISSFLKYYKLPTCKSYYQQGSKFVRKCNLEPSWTKALKCIY